VACDYYSHLPSSIVSPLSAACSLRPATVIFCFHLPYSINSSIAGSGRKMWYNNVLMKQITSEVREDAG
jgi:hypothetical protein